MSEFAHPHICTQYCALGEGWDSQPGRSIDPHPGVRPVDHYLYSGEPPFCTVCGHELVIWPEEFGAAGEAHANMDLDPFEKPRS